MQNTKQIYFNLALLSLSLSMVVIGNVLIFTGTSIIARELAPPEYATIPLFLMIFGAISATWPMSLFMSKHGRRLGLQVGAFAGVLGGVIAAIAVEEKSFPVMLLAYFFIGIHYAAVPYYRFAGVDVAGPKLVNRGLAFVLSGGILASLVGPSLVDWSKDALSTPFTGCYLMMSVVMMTAILLLTQLQAPKPVLQRSSAGRSLQEISKTPVFQLAFFMGISAYTIMVLLMVTAPMAVQDCGFPFVDISSMIQYHILGMYLPSLFSASVLDRLGKLPTMFVGTTLCFGTVALAQMGQERWQFFVGQALLGVGWNFMYLGASSLLTESYRPEEQAKVQGLNEFSTLGFVALANLAAGVLYQKLGWVVMNQFATTVIVAVMLVQLYLTMKITQQSRAILE